jgi:hypothetical protein
MMNFLLFYTALGIAGLVALVIFSAGLMACLYPFYLFSKSAPPSKVTMLPMAAIAGLYQMYFWGLWSAFCVTMTISTWDWLYWMSGFFFCGSLIGWLTHKEQRAKDSLSETRDIHRGAMLYGFVAVIAFVMFALNPSLMDLTFGWALRPLGLALDGSGTTEAN